MNKKVSLNGSKKATAKIKNKAKSNKIKVTQVVRGKRIYKTQKELKYHLRKFGGPSSGRTYETFTPKPKPKSKLTIPKTTIPRFPIYGSALTQRETESSLHDRIAQGLPTPTPVIIKKD
jgi:hypothetical protein